MNGYGIAIIPLSWAFGFWHKPHKTIFAIGPLRFVFYFNLPAWKE